MAKRKKQIHFKRFYNTVEFTGKFARSWQVEKHYLIPIIPCYYLPLFINPGVENFYQAK